METDRRNKTSNRDVMKAPFKTGDKVVIDLATHTFPIAGTIGVVEEPIDTDVLPRLIRRVDFEAGFILWKNLHFFTFAKWRPRDMEPVCLHCGHPIGVPVRPGEPDKWKAESVATRPNLRKNELMMCVKCTEWMMTTDEGGLRLATPQERAVLLVTRGAEMIKMLAIAIQVRDYEQRMKQ